jgi:2,4-dichlorophenol 6-monooxygenase
MTSTVGVPDLTGAIDTDVLIIGAGGRGLALSLLLADYGADHLQIERHPDTAIQPKASYLNQRTMEIFRQHDVSEAVYAVGAPTENMQQVRWCTSLGGDDAIDGQTSPRKAGDPRRGTPLTASRR